MRAWQFQKTDDPVVGIAQATSMADYTLTKAPKPTDVQHVAHIPYFIKTDDLEASGEAVLAVGVAPEPNVSDQNRSFLITLSFLQVEPARARPVASNTLAYRLLIPDGNDAARNAAVRVALVSKEGKGDARFLVYIGSGSYGEVHFGSIDCRKGLIAVHKAVAGPSFSDVRVASVAGDTEAFVVRGGANSACFASDGKSIDDLTVPEPEMERAHTIQSGSSVVAWSEVLPIVSRRLTTIMAFMASASIDVEGTVVVADESGPWSFTVPDAVMVLSLCIGTRLVVVHKDGSLRVVNFERIAGGAMGTVARNWVPIVASLMIFAATMKVYQGMKEIL